FTDEEFKDMCQLCDFVIAAKRDGDDVIEFDAGSIVWLPWKGLLAQGWALLLSCNRRDILVVGTGDFDILPTRRPLLQAGYNVRCVGRGRTRRGTLWSPALAKFERWKGNKPSKPATTDGELRQVAGY